MKKLMMIAAVAACAVQAQAATTWTATIDFGKDYSGYSVWAVNCWNDARYTAPAGSKTETAPLVGYFDVPAFGGKIDYQAELDNATTAEKQLEILGYAKNSKYDGIVSATYAFGTVGADGMATLTSSSGKQYSWLFVLTSDEVATYGTEYAVIRAHESPDVVSYDKEGVPSYTTDFTKYTIANANTTFMTDGIVAIPEPTSGLLLLLGMAGLALKRKRA